MLLKHCFISPLFVNHNMIFTNSPTESFQKVVRISSNGKLMASGGCDGYVRLWRFPTLKPLRDIKAHDKEIDDVDFSPDSQKV